MPDFEKWTVKALKEYCKEHKIKIPAGMRKAEILDLIDNDDNVITKKKTFIEKRQKIIKKALLVCRKKGEKEILDYFERRLKNKRLKQTFDIYKLNLKKPNTNEIRVCLKYYQENNDYSEDEKLLLNQMITQTKYIDSDYVDHRLAEFQRLNIESATYDIPLSTSKKRKSLNKIHKV